MKWILRERAIAWANASILIADSKLRPAFARAMERLMRQAYQHGRDDEAQYQRERRQNNDNH